MSMSKYSAQQAGRTDLDRLVADVEAECDTLVEGSHGLPGTVDVCHLLGLHVALLVVDSGFNHTVTDCLQNPKTQGHMCVMEGSASAR